MKHHSTPAGIALACSAIALGAGCRTRSDAQRLPAARECTSPEPPATHTALADAAPVTEQHQCPIYDLSRRWEPERWSREIDTDVFGANISEPVIREVLDFDRFLPTHASIWLRSVHLTLAAALFHCETETSASTTYARLSWIIRPDGTTLLPSISTGSGLRYPDTMSDAGPAEVSPFFRCVIDRLEHTNACPHRAREPLLVNVVLVRSSNPWR